MTDLREAFHVIHARKCPMAADCVANVTLAELPVVN